MISYEPLWATMKEKEITKYQLIYHWGISSNTLRRMGHGEPITSNTLNELCLILDCRVENTFFEEVPVSLKASDKGYTPAKTKVDRLENISANTPDQMNNML